MTCGRLCDRRSHPTAVDGAAGDETRRSVTISTEPISHHRHRPLKKPESKNGCCGGSDAKCRRGVGEERLVRFPLVWSTLTLLPVSPHNASNR